MAKAECAVRALLQIYQIDAAASFDPTGSAVGQKRRLDVTLGNNTIPAKLARLASRA